MTTHTLRRSGVILLAAGAAAAAAAAGGVGSTAGAAPSVDQSDGALRAKSAGLTVAPDLGWAGAGRAYESDAEARNAAGQASTLVPLPDGGNINGIRFDEVEGQLTDADIQGVLEHNAACQWWRALRDGRRPDLAASIAADISKWPSFRSAEQAEIAGRAASELTNGGGQTASGVLADCDASHEREVKYARSRGWQPSG